MIRYLTDGEGGGAAAAGEGLTLLTVVRPVRLWAEGIPSCARTRRAPLGAIGGMTE